MADRSPDREGPAIHVVGANPALDRLQVVATFTPFAVNRADHVVARAGGKSLIVARAIRRLGGRVVLHGFLGGPVADVIARECAAEGIVERHVRIAGDTRTTVVIVESDTGRTTVVNEPGPDVGAVDVEKLLRGLEGALRPGDIVVLTGSLPPGVPVDFYATLVDTARRLDVPVLVDASGPPLRAAAAAGPTLLKVNEQEFELLAKGRHLTEVPGFLDAMEDVRRANGIDIVIVTRGERGAVAVDGTSVYTVTTPLVRTVNATGSGDAFFGALALTLAQSGTASLPDGLRRGAAAGAANAVRLDPDIGDAAEVFALAEAVDVQVTARKS